MRSTEQDRKCFSRRRLVMVAAASAIAPSGAVADPRRHVIIVDTMKFGPQPTGVHVGDTVVWVNLDIFRHTATAPDGAFNVDLPPCASRGAIMGSAGAFAWVCSFHPGMTGQVVVA